MFGDHFNNHDGSVLVIPQEITQTFNDGSVSGSDGAGAETAIALDHINSLVSNGSVTDANVSNEGNGMFNHDFGSSQGGTADPSNMPGVGTSTPRPGLVR